MKVVQIFDETLQEPPDSYASPESVKVTVIQKSDQVHTASQAG